MFGNVQSFDRGDRTLLAKPKKKDTKKIDAVNGQRRATSTTEKRMRSSRSLEPCREIEAD